ncbi:MAG: hypothetical protein H7239_05275 [Flavobacterium sp.]|nr:hypothetical protein [Flavobacterium sp.]
MKINKKAKLIIGSILGIFLLFFLILVYHIATAKPVVVDEPHLQISRIDFSEPLDSAQAKQVCKDLRTIQGITKDSILVKRNVVVYFHDNSLTNSQKVFDQLMTKRKYNAKPFFVSKELASKSVCPAMKNNSFSFRFSREIQRIFN